MFAEIFFISKSFVVAQVPGAVVGFVVGAFTPSIGRRIKSFFVKEASVVKADVQGAVSKAGQAVASASTDVAKKL